MILQSYSWAYNQKKTWSEGVQASFTLLPFRKTGFPQAFCFATFKSECKFKFESIQRWNLNQS